MTSTVSLRNSCTDERLLGILSDTDYKDVTLICVDGQLQAHRLVLASVSPFLKRLMLDVRGEIVLLLPELAVEVIRKAVQLIYTGSVLLTPDLRKKVHDACDLLQINLRLVHEVIRDGCTDKSESEAEGQICATSVSLLETEGKEPAIDDSSDSVVSNASDANEDGRHRCAFCGKGFKRQGWKKSHEESHKMPRHKCHFCGCRFAFPFEKVQHEKRCGAARGSDSRGKETDSPVLQASSDEEQYKCQFCDRRFRGKAQKQLHEKKHGSNSYECRFCREPFDFAVDKKRHELQCSSTRGIHSCKCCGTKFVQPSDWTDHRCTCNASGCHKGSVGDGPSFSSVRKEEVGVADQAQGNDEDASCEMKQPIDSKATENGDLIKTNAAQSTVKRQGGDKKKRRLGSSETFKCKECEKVYRSAAGLEYHRRLHNGERPFVCDVCGKSFRTRQGFRSHAVAHSGGDVFPCEECGKPFKTVQGLTAHKNMHAGRKPFLCPIEGCEKAYFSQGSLCIHKLSHTQEKRFECNVCKKGFTVLAYLKKHQVVHTDARPHPCSVCGKTFKSMQQVQVHLRTHSVDRPYVCHMCGKTYKCRETLAVHEKTHSSERPYACETCGKRFKKGGDLYCHRKLHSAVKRFQCHVCNMAFHTNYNLKCHLVLHTGERRYQCLVCGDRFKRKYHVDVHMKTHKK